MPMHLSTGRNSRAHVISNFFMLGTVIGTRRPPRRRKDVEVHSVPFTADVLIIGTFCFPHTLPREQFEELLE
jgi:hypothetical protein